MSTLQNPKTAHSQKSLLELPQKHRFEWTRWVLLILAVYVLIVVADLLIFNDTWNWSLVLAHLFSERVLAGVWNTILLTVLTLFFGLLLGLVVCFGRLSRFAVLRASATIYIWLVRSIPPLAILLLIYFLGVLKPTLGVGFPFMPYIIEWPTNALISPFTAAVIGLTFYLGGKSAEIFRSGFLAVDRGQREAVKALGIPPTTAFLKVVGPQATRVLIPPLANEVVTMFKNTSLVSVVGFAELLTTSQRLYATNFETIPMLTVACIWYITLTSVLMIGQLWIEQRLSRGYSRHADSSNSDSGKTDAEAPDEGVSLMSNSLPVTLSSKGSAQ